VLKELSSKWLPKLLSDSDPDVQCAALSLTASVSRLYAKAALPWSFLEQAGDSIATLVGPGSAVPGKTALLAARHYLAAASAAGFVFGAAGAKVAAAVSERAVHKSCEDAEDGERTLAAALSAGAEELSEKEVKAALDKLIACTDGKTAQSLKDYGSKRLKALSQQTGRCDFEWDL